MEPQDKTEEQLLEELQALESRFSQMKKALGESEEKFRLLYENAPLGYQSLDQNGFFLAVNPAWLALLGYDSEEVIGKWCGDFLTEPYREKFLVNFPKFRAAGVFHGTEFQMKRKDGSTVVVEVDGKISRDQWGNFRQTHCVLRDVTALRQTQAD